MEEIIKILRREKGTTEYAQSAESLKRRQLRRIEEYTLQKQKWVEDYNGIGFFLSKGGENEVYANDDPYVYKYNNFEFAGDDILNFF